MEERRGLLTWRLSIDLTRLFHKGEPGKSTGRRRRRSKSRDKGTTFCDHTSGLWLSRMLGSVDWRPAGGVCCWGILVRNPPSVAAFRPAQDVAIRSAGFTPTNAYFLNPFFYSAILARFTEGV